MNINKQYSGRQPWRVLPVTAIVLALCFTTSAKSVLTKPAEQSNEYFTLTERSIATLSPLNRVAMADFRVKTLAKFKLNDTPHFRVCGNIKLVPDFHSKLEKKKILAKLANYFVPAIPDSNVHPEDWAVGLTLTDSHYRVRVPLVYSDKIDKASEETFGLSVSHPVPFGNLVPHCVTAGDVISVQQHVKLLPLTEVAPIFQPLDWKKQLVSADGKSFTATVSILGAVPENTVVWTDETDSKHPQQVNMTRKEDIISQARTVNDVALPAELIGGVYTADIQIPTQINYTASVTLKNATGKRGSAVLVNGEDSQPNFQFTDCSDTQCIIKWGAVIPYRNDNNSLDISFATGWSPRVKDRKPPKIYSIQPDSRWQEPDLFPVDKASPDSILVQANTTQYFGPQSSLFSSNIMPHLGAFTLNFEPVAD